MRTLVAVVGAMVLGFLLMAPLATLFDAMNWPMFHTWGLVHGSFLIAWPLLAMLVYQPVKALVVGVKRRRK